MLHRPLDYEFDTPAPCAASECSVEDWLTFLGHRWNALIMWHLTVSPKRFGELTACLKGITPKILTERLQTLEQRGLVARSPKQTFPRSVTYTLTREGAEITDIIRQMEPWAKRLEAREKPSRPKMSPMT